MADSPHSPKTQIWTSAKNTLVNGTLQHTLCLVCIEAGEEIATETFTVVLKTQQGHLECQV